MSFSPAPQVPTSWDGEVPSGQLSPRAHPEGGVGSDFGDPFYKEDDREDHADVGDVAGELANLAEGAETFEKSMMAIARAASAVVASAEAGAGERVAHTGQEARAAALSGCIAAGDVETRSALGQKFNQYMKANAEEAAKYKAAGQTKGQAYQLKKEFRLRWAAAELEGVTVVKKSKLESYQIVEAEMGTYQPLEMIVKAEGGRHSPTAWRAAYAYAEKAMKLGGQWLSYNEFTNRVDILYVKKTKQNIFNTVWSLYQEQIQQTDTKAEATTAGGSMLETPVKVPAAESGNASLPAAALDTDGEKGNKRKAEEQVNSGGPPPTPTKQTKGGGMSAADKDNQKTLRAAQTTKILYSKVSTAHTSRMVSLTSDVEWADLATPATVKRLEVLYDDMLSSCQEVFAAEFLHHELVDLKKKYRDDMAGFHFNIKHFESNVGPKVKCLETEQVRLNRMHLAGKATTK
jgi:hypothetical protein